MDEIAVQIGVKPNLLSVAMTDPYLAARCYFGPCVPAQYRLMGPGKWDDAPKVIRAVFQNHQTGMKRRHVTQKPEVHNSQMRTFIFVKDLLLVIIFFMMMGFIYQFYLF